MAAEYSLRIGLGKNVGVFDRNMLGLGTAVRSGGNICMEDAFVWEGSPWFGFHDCTIAVVLNVDGAVVIGDDGIAWHRYPIGHFDDGFLCLSREA